ncbi:MAG: XkdQ/YqbQ family protein [Bacillota bacterium]|jgi:3D (Asp-Asp-Asp) domain-containing protein
MYKVLWGKKDITSRVSSITWSGSVTEAARRLEISVAYAPRDGGIGVLNIDCGDMIYFFEDQKEWFRGRVVYRERIGGNGTVTYTAYDDIFYLNRRKAFFNYTAVPAEEIARRLLADAGFSVGSLDQTGVPVDLLSNGLTVYDAIMAAYTAAHRKTGHLYAITTREGKINVIRRGWVVSDFILSDDRNISDATWSESVEDMINAVVIKDSAGKTIGSVENADWIAKYKKMSDLYVQEENVDSTTAARAMLAGPRRDASISAAGNCFCLFGNAVSIKDTGTGIVGKFAIESDSHTFENGAHMMDLALMFDAYMDEKEGDTAADDDTAIGEGSVNGVCWPAPQYTRMSSGYGYRICPFHGREFHDGIDLAAPGGSPILAFKSGVVTRAVKSSSGYGNCLYIQHENGLLSFYGHCRTLLVGTGAKVNAGQKIALVGTTGSSTGNHLHFGVHLNDKSVNPQNYVKPTDTASKLAAATTAAGSGTTVSALFTAYYPANNKMEGGFYDALGKRLNPAANTCAAPKSIPFGTKIKIMDTGTGRDGQVYTVNDRGGAITVKNGVYHFDILMSTNAECNRWGKVYGKAVIIK